jgi:hypothetical protein
VFGKIVRVQVVDVDRYRREVGRIYLGDRFINLEMVRDGFAWRYVRYDKTGEFTASEGEAREQHRGLWADPNPVPPWEYRRERRSVGREGQEAAIRVHDKVRFGPPGSSHGKDREHDYRGGTNRQHSDHVEFQPRDLGGAHHRPTWAGPNLLLGREDVRRQKQLRPGH